MPYVYYYDQAEDDQIGGERERDSTRMVNPEKESYKHTATGRVGKMQMLLNEADERLDEQVKREHPILSWEEMQQMYPDQWVAITITKMDRGLNEPSGRVFAHAANGKLFREEMRMLEERYPGKHLSKYFTGTFVMADVGVIL